MHPPFKNYEELIETYGYPGSEAWAEKWITEVSIEISMNRTRKVQCNKTIAALISEIFEELKDKNLIELVVSYDGCYVYRNIRCSSELSMHAFGLAIDIDASEYGLGSSKRLPDSIVNIFKSKGFFYGGDFIHRKDPMHFEYTTGVI